MKAYLFHSCQQMQRHSETYIFPARLSLHHTNSLLPYNNYLDSALLLTTPHPCLPFSLIIWEVLWHLTLGCHSAVIISITASPIHCIIYSNDVKVSQSFSNKNFQPTITHLQWIQHHNIMITMFVLCSIVLFCNAF